MQSVILIEGSVNVLVLLAKVFVGFTTGSLAVLGDAVHSLTDVINNVIAWVVIRMSRQPADREHPYGHRKFETLAVFVLASLLVVLAFELAVRAISTPHSTLTSNPLLLGIMLGVLAVNIVLTVWQRYWARRLKSDILLADASHTFADVLVTIGVIAGWQLSVMGYPWLDRVCALGVCVLVLVLAYGLFKRAVPVLVDEIAVDPEGMTQVVEEVSGVEEVNRVRSRWIGPLRAVDMVISVRPELSTEQSHDISDEVEAVLRDRFGIEDISIHVEPLNNGGNGGSA